MSGRRVWNLFRIADIQELKNDSAHAHMRLSKIGGETEGSLPRHFYYFDF